MQNTKISFHANFFLVLSVIAFIILFINTTNSKKGNEALQVVEEDVPLDLMGLMELCDDGDEECMERRLIAEAHLDYIYTQHHKP